MMVRWMYDGEMDVWTMECNTVYDSEMDVWWWDEFMKCMMVRWMYEWIIIIIIMLSYRNLRAQ